MSSSRYPLNASATDHAPKFGIIGFGNVAVAHFAGLKINRYKLAGFCTKKPAVRNGDATGLEFNIGPTRGILFDTYAMTITDNYRELLKESSIEAVIVCKRTTDHPLVAVDAAAAGKHVLVEKPLSLGSPAGSTMIRECKQAGVKLAVGHVLPAFPAYELLLEALKKRFDEVQTLSMQRSLPWSCVADAPIEGGYFADLAVHDFHLLSCISRPVSVCALTHTADSGDIHHVLASLKFKDNPRATFMCEIGCTTKVQGFLHSYRVVFRNGDELAFDGVHIKRNGKILQLPERTIGEIFALEQRIFVDWFQGKRPDPGFLDSAAALNALKIVEAVTRSVDKNKSEDV